MSASDLSEYERLRLENIRRNAEFLAQLGIQSTEQKQLEQKKAEEAVVQKKKAEKAEKAEKAVRTAKYIIQPEVALRRSSRLSGSKFESPEKEEAGVDHSETASESGVHYDSIPQESDQLDDLEFQAFVALRKWRLLRARELGIETYKIFQNRTLCELIRRRRNDASWARTGTTTEAVERTIKEEGHSAQDRQAVADALTDCWGVGPSKAKEGGFAWEALEVLDGSEIEGLLAASRQETVP